MKKRVFIERKKGFDIEKKELGIDLLHNFGINLTSLRYFIFYDIFNIDDDVYNQTLSDVLTESNRDSYTYTLPNLKNIIAYESLPGQFNQRSDSAIQCIKLLSPGASPYISSGLVILFDEDISSDNLKQIKKYMINTVESREKDFSLFEIPSIEVPGDIEVISNFTRLSSNKLKDLHEYYGFAMSYEDLEFVQNYFKKDEKRSPFVTELKVLDTYWSDHCRHTTFETEISDVSFSDGKYSNRVEKSFLDYLNTRKALNRDNKPITLMDVATINAKLEKSLGNLNDLEISEEINAASIYIDVDVDGIDEKWLLMFKNETHNHPTEIEPFGGASTCIGGAIRDPLSGRSYVYSAMRVTGAADITEDISKTIPGKLPQSVISKESARGYSSYGNQIGLATSFVDEIYHDGYKAKRMEIGAVIGAVKADSVRRETPSPGDIVLLLGGKTGRDGIGGATGSSKVHTKKSLDVSSAEVQKGNAPEERKIQRLFRNPLVTKLIKKSNDFGAGGVSVAIGELADGILINLDKVPTKYEGINGTELAISESQERMAVVVEKADVKLFEKYCQEENIEVSEVALITNEKRLVMLWKEKEICNISREFINTSGVRQKITIDVTNKEINNPFEKKASTNIKEQITTMLQDKNISSKQGLVEMFDSSIGRTTVLSPFGGKYKLTKTQTSIHKLPVGPHKTNTVSMMAYGFNPYVSEWSPFHGSTYAIIESMAKIVSSGGNYQKIRFTFQEYFERLNKDSKLWSKPFTSLMGAYSTLKEFGLSAIGGKDSMSGTYHELTVPPTLVSFAVAIGKVDDVISPEFKTEGNYLYLFDYKIDNELLPDFADLKQNFENINSLIKSKQIVSAYSLSNGGLAEAIIKSTFGNKIGCEISTDYELTKYRYGAILVESTVEIDMDNTLYLGKTVSSKAIKINDFDMLIDEAISLNQKKYNEIFPIFKEDNRLIPNYKKSSKVNNFTIKNSEEIRVLIPVFPGTNCEYDCEAAFINEGAKVKTIVFNNQNETEISNSLNRLAAEIDNSHIIMLSGGFSSGDEPDGSGKFIANVLRTKMIKDALNRFLDKKHLILGICNGFQALIKAGLLPYGEIKPIEEGAPTLFKNRINRHVAKFVETKVSSLNSPWLESFRQNETHTIAMSHGEGQFIIDKEGYQKLLNNNQVAFQYVDEENNPTYKPLYNPNGSSYAIEGIVSEDGLILGKMGHSERYQEGLFKNIHGNKVQNIFRNGVNYFRNGRYKDE